MNDPEVMERIMEALEKIAYYIEVQVGRQWLSMLNHAKFALDIIQGIVLAIMKHVHATVVTPSEPWKNRRN